MEPLNKDARRKSFTSFLTLFLITIGLVVALVFFSVQVPFKDNEKLRKEVIKFDKEKMQAERFSLTLKETMDLMEKLSVSGDINNSGRLDAEVTKKINEMYALGGADSTVLKTLYSDVVTVMFQLQAANGRLRNASSADQDIEALRAELNQWKMQANMYQQQNDQLRIELSRR
jgi:hypothetical protein